ncbi:MAG: DMT family transporter [Dehalococcoidia bacterium]|nr:DMT family transporter [Dehalococcoidia bacterium]
MLGALLGVASAMVFAVSNTFLRRGVLKASSGYVANITIFTGLALFIVITGVTGGLSQLGQYSWRVYALFAIQGIVHFALGRTFAYRSVQLLGVVRSQVPTNLNVVVTIVLALILFRETVTPRMVVGIALCVLGPILLSAREPVQHRSLMTNTDHKKVDRRTLSKGIFFGLGTALFWGGSTILVKLALNEGGTPIFGNLIAYLAASIVISPSVFAGTQSRKEIFSTRKGIFLLALFCGLATSIAHILRYFALEYGSVIVVSLMYQTGPLWVMLLAFIFNRNYESFSRWALLGNGAITVGVVLILLP